ncbi:MAG: polysaccharide biosynthesis/export family protein [Terriglobales bacterium]
MRTRTATIVAAALLFVFAAAWAQQQPSAAGQNLSASASQAPSASAKAPADDPMFQTRHPRYKLELGDTFDINFDLSPEFNQTVTVQPDGYVTLRGIGDLHVADLTVPELTANLRTAYNKILNDPPISITLKDFEKPYFIADGQVDRPGKYDLRGDTTLTQAIAIAGGFKDASAKHSQVLLFRRASEGWYSAKIFNVKKWDKEGDLHEDPFLHPGDMLFVPQNTISKIKPFIPGSSVGTFINPATF